MWWERRRERTLVRLVRVQPSRAGELPQLALALRVHEPRRLGAKCEEGQSENSNRRREEPHRSNQASPAELWSEARATPLLPLSLFAKMSTYAALVVRRSNPASCAPARLTWCSPSRLSTRPCPGTRPRSRRPPSRRSPSSSSSSLSFSRNTQQRTPAQVPLPLLAQPPSAHSLLFRSVQSKGFPSKELAVGSASALLGGFGLVFAFCAVGVNV